MAVAIDCSLLITTPTTASGILLIILIINYYSLGIFEVADSAKSQFPPHIINKDSILSFGNILDRSNDLRKVRHLLQIWALPWIVNYRPIQL